MIATQLFTGLVLGMVLVLLAFDLSQFFGRMTVLNVAHEAVYMLGRTSDVSFRASAAISGWVC